MTYAQESLALAQTLARLLDGGARDVDRTGFHQALLARSAVLDLAAAVHAEVAGTRKVAGAAAGAVELDPVAALGRALADQPRIAGPAQAPTQTLAGTSRTAAGREWARAARHALIAHHDWVTALPRRWTPEQAWTAVADGAGLAEATARLDGPLAAAASRLGHVQEAAALERASVSGLRITAAEVSALARSGPLDDAGIQRQPRRQHHVRPVGRTADLPLAQDQLVVLLRQARTVQPEHAVQIAVCQARTATVVARLLRRASVEGVEAGAPAAMATALDTSVQALLSVTAAAGKTAQLRRGDPRPMQQAGEIDRQVRRITTDRLDSTEVDALLATAQRLPDVVRTLSLIAVREATGGRWLVPGQGDVAGWTVVEPGRTDSTLVTALRDATAASRAVQTTAVVPVRTITTSSAPSAPVWTALAAALSSGDRQRPPVPSDRPPLARPGPARGSAR